MATRIIVEIDGKEVAATTIHPDPSPGIAEGVDVPAVPASFKPPPELLARARALGASSAGPAPSLARTPTGGLVAIHPARLERVTRKGNALDAGASLAAPHSTDPAEMRAASKPARGRAATKRARARKG